jgi:hypothetical protein
MINSFALQISLLTLASFNVYAYDLIDKTITTEILSSATNQLIFAQDLAEVMPLSTVKNPHIPLGLQAHFDIEYKGAIRPIAGGESSSNYAIGTLGYNPKNNSLYMAGHAHHNAIAEFEIPKKLSMAQDAKNIPKAKVLQPFSKALDRVQVGKKTDKITGLLWYDDRLLVNSEIWYDASGTNKDNLQVFNANDLSEQPKGMLQLAGEAKAAGYMGHIPDNLQTKLGGNFFTGWASNYSITSRYSQGPSFYIFNPQDAVDADIATNITVATTAKMVFPHSADKEMVEGGTKYKKDISPIWGPNARAVFGFIIPNSDFFMVVGRHAGVNSGIGYKITQDNGNVCGGQCPYKVGDIYNYFWLFNVNDIADAAFPWKVQPVSYGKWIMPFKGEIIGSVFDSQSNTLYLSVQGAGRVGEYDRPPLIVAYKLESTRQF